MHSPGIRRVRRNLLAVVALALVALAPGCTSSSLNVIHGFTVPDSPQAGGEPGVHLLCVARKPGDSDAVCGGVVYPGKRPGCGFGFDFTRSQSIVVRVHKASGVTALEPLELDGHGFSC